jgi:hypothetical protein
MIDTLNFKLPSTQYDREAILRIFANKAKEGAVTYYPNNNKAIDVNYKNYRFRLTDFYLTAYGSINKLHYGNNLQQLSFVQLQDEIARMEDFFEISLNDAQIIRIDFACNIEVDKPVSQYLNLFTSPKGYKSIIYEGETAYYESSKEKLIFYDKGKELQAKRQQILLGNEHKNILRYEVSVKNNIASVLNWEDTKLENLHNYHDYISLLKRLVLAYRSLPIHSEPLPSQLSFDTLTAFKNSVITEGIRSMGGMEAINEAVKQGRMKREVKHSIRKFLKALPSGQTLNPELKNELDRKILAICKQEAHLAFEWSD